MKQRDEPEQTRRGGADTMPDSLLYNLVYCSRAADSLEDRAVATLVASAQRFKDQATGQMPMASFGQALSRTWPNIARMPCQGSAATG